MSKKTKVSYYVMVTFDITVGNNSNIYSDVSKLLEENGLTKDVDGNELPENVYFGSRSAEVTHEGELPTQGELKSRGAAIAQRYYNLLKEFFESKNIKYKLFITVSRKSTTSIKYTITKK